MQSKPHCFAEPQLRISALIAYFIFAYLSGQTSKRRPLSLSFSPWIDNLGKLLGSNLRVNMLKISSHYRSFLKHLQLLKVSSRYFNNGNIDRDFHWCLTALVLQLNRYYVILMLSNVVGMRLLLGKSEIQSKKQHFAQNICQILFALQPQSNIHIEVILYLWVAVELA